MDSQDIGHDPVHALAVARDGAGNSLWFVARASGLYRSGDDGETWSDAYVALGLDAQLTTASVATSPHFASDRTIFAGALGGILRSVDGGDTWIVSELPAPPPFVVSLVVSPNFDSDGLVFAGTLDDGVFRSWDRGVTWASWNFGLLDLNVFCLVASPNFASDDTLFVGTESGVFRSTNGGRAWRETSFPIDSSPVLSLAAAEVGGQYTIYAGTEAHGVLWSGDGGGSWHVLSLGERVEPINHLLTVGTEVATAGVVVVAGTTVFFLRQGDASTEELWPSTRGVEVSAAAIDHVNHGFMLLLAMNDGSVQRIALPTVQD